jgi:hypothetical protein
MQALYSNFETPDLACHNFEMPTLEDKYLDTHLFNLHHIQSGSVRLSAIFEIG